MHANVLVEPLSLQGSKRLLKVCAFFLFNKRNRKRTKKGKERGKGRGGGKEEKKEERRIAPLFDPLQ